MNAILPKLQLNLRLVFLGFSKKAAACICNTIKKEQRPPSAQEEMVSKVLAMESFTEENYVGLKEYVMDLKVSALAFHLAQFSKAAKAVGDGS